MSNVLELGTRFRTVSSAMPTIPFDSGNVRSVELPRSFLYRDLSIRVAGSYTMAAGTGALAAARIIDSPLQIVSNIQLVADGRKILWTASARDLWDLCHIYYGKQPELVPPSQANTAGGNSNFAFTIVIPNRALRMMLPADSLFDPREYEKIELRLTWGTQALLLSAGTITNFTATASIDVQQTTEGVEHAAFNRIIQFDEQSATASSSNFTFNVPRSGLLAGILLYTEAGSTIEAVDNLINFVSLKSDNSFNHVDRVSWADIQRRNVIEYQLDDIWQNFLNVNTGAAGADTLTTTKVGKLTQQHKIGKAFIDLTEDGLMTSCLNTLALNVLQLVVDITGATSGLIRATYVFYEPIRPLVAAA